MTAAVARSTIQVFRSGAYLTLTDGDGFDATSAEIAAFLPIGAIYPLGTAAGSTPNPSTPSTAAAATLAALIASLPQTMPGTVGALWNNGGILSIVQP